MTDLYNKIAGLASNNMAKSLANSYGLAIQTVTWEDTARFKGSCWGPNISDMTLTTEDKNMPVIRRPNMADLTCDIPSENFSVLVGNEKGRSLQKISLQEYIKNIREYTDNQNIQDLWLSRDENLLLSSQACILPLRDDKVNFNVKLFNYQSSESEPAVLVIVSSQQGTSCQVISGRDNLYLNENGMAYDFVAKRLEDDRKERGVSTKGPMTEEEKARNVILIYQIPLKIERKPTRGGTKSFLGDKDKMKVYSFCNSTSTTAFDNCVHSAPEPRGFDHAMLFKGDSKGSYKGTKGMTLKRDENYPIRLTLQYYYVADTVTITEPLIKQIADQLEKSYSFGKDKSSLTMGQTDRPTEPKNLEGTAASIKYYPSPMGDIKPASGVTLSAFI